MGQLLGLQPQVQQLRSIFFLKKKVLFNDCAPPETLKTYNQGEPRRIFSQLFVFLRKSVTNVGPSYVHRNIEL